MLEISPNSPVFDWEYSISTEPQLVSQTNKNNNIDLDGVFSSNFPSIEIEEEEVWRGESAQSTSTIDHMSAVCILAKKLNHNASERDRRKKINSLYASLGALLPKPNQGKRLSVPNTVELVLKYIPNLQKEVDELNNKKKQLLSKISLFQGGDHSSLVKKRKREINNKEKSRNTIFINYLTDQEIVIQISTYDKISLREVMLLLEKNGLVIVDVSSFLSFGGRTFYNLHLHMERTNTLKSETLKEELRYMIEKPSKRMRR